jgi:hypothetical protein
MNYPIPVSEVIFIDFEFVAGVGEQPKPVCVVARELTSGRISRVWLEGERRPDPPFPCGPDVLIIGYYVSAEMGCFLALNWKMPRLVVDLFAEFRTQTNGLTLPHGNGLLGAMQWFGLNGMEAAKKDSLRQRILTGAPYSPQDREEILAYCESDVNALPELYDRLMVDPATLIPALWRGEFMKAIALAEFTGVPIDSALYRMMEKHWPALQAGVVAQVNQSIPVFDGVHFRERLFESWLDSRKLLEEWPRTPTDEIALDDDTLQQMASLHSEIRPLRQARQMLGQMHKLGLAVGGDGRNRCLLSPFSTKTGRCAPSTTKFIFGNPGYMRSLIRPEAGKALAYIDWEQQEFGIGAALSGDPVMQEAYCSGDVYLTFAKLAKAVPETATKETHAAERDLFKTVVLGTQYLIGPVSLAFRLGVTLQEAADLLRLHRRIFSRFWEWSDAVSDYSQLYGSLTAALGWRLEMSPSTNLRTARNFVLQANASEMLRLAMAYTLEAGITVVGPVHDATLVEADDDEIEHAISETQMAMEKASRIVLDGFPLRTEVQTIRAPNRFPLKDENAQTWRWMMDSLRRLEGADNELKTGYGSPRYQVNPVAQI